MTIQQLNYAITISEQGSFNKASEVLYVAQPSLMVGLNGYTLCSGIICEELNGSDYKAIPFKHDDEHPSGKMKIG